MRKEYRIENLDCAHCAMKMEDAARKVDGVRYLSVNFIAMKLTLEADDGVFQRVFRNVEKACRAIEPDVSFSENRYRLSGGEKSEVVRIAAAVLLFIGAKIAESAELLPEGALWSLLLFLPAYLAAGYDVVRKAVSGIFRGKFFDENFLMTIATFGAFAIGEAGEGVTVMLLYSIGEFFQGLAVAKSRRSIAELMNIRPDGANLIEGDKIRRVSPEEVPIGSLILVKPGEKIPLDGTVTEGSGFLDTSALTGESLPREVTVGSKIQSGCINMNSPLKIKTETSYCESSVAKILSLIENAGETKSRAERFISRFARFYTPVVVCLALFLAIIPPLFGGEISLWIHKAVTCLVISCPCALVISVPLSFFGGIGSAGSRGILIKGADSLEKLAKAKVCAFDKTGTLTRGSFEVTAIHPEIIGEDELLELAATCEHYSDHPISLSLKAAFRGTIRVERIGKIQEDAGYGVTAQIDGVTYYVGNSALMDSVGVNIVPCNKCDHVGSVVHVAKKTEYLGHIVISDKIRDDAHASLKQLQSVGIRRFCLLSGDDAKTASHIGTELGINEIYAPLLPHEKLSCLKQIQEDNKEGNVLFIGDGINDTPVLAEADLGIAMGGIGADAAIEAADVILTQDKLSKLALAIRIAKKTFSIVWQNVILSIGIKLFVLIPNIFLGEESVPLWLAIFADVGVCLIAVLNAARALHIKEKK